MSEEIKESKQEEENQQPVENTEKDLKQIAMDLYEGKIFTDRHLLMDRQEHMLPSVFMPIMLGAFSSKSEEELKNTIGMIYEYYSEAGPRSINGFPIFFSLKVLSPKETEKMFLYFEEYKKMKEAFSKME